MKFELTNETPVWRFYYQGGHSHPVRRTVVVVEQKGNVITGYEMRHGNEVRSTIENAPIKSFRIDRIAKVGQLDARRPLRRKSQKDRTTLTRDNLVSLLVKGV